MLRYLIKKALILLLSLWCVITGTFFLMHAIPGDPFLSDQFMTQDTLKALYAYYGLDQPLWIQYGTYLKQLASGNLGVSMIYQGRTVNQLIYEGFPISAILGFQALVIAIPGGILLGTLAALKRGKWQDTMAMVMATLGISVPNFVLSSALQFLICTQWHLLPVARWGSWSHTILPTLALTALPLAFVARLTRSNMIDALQQDYIRTAMAKGLPPFRIAIRHGLRNAALPVVAYLGPLIAHVLTGSFIVEKIFAIPGLGQWLIYSIQGRDYPMILGLVVFFSALLMSMTFLTDLAYAALDPRIRLKASYA